MLSSSICRNKPQILKRCNYVHSKYSVDIKKLQISGTILAIDDDKHCRLVFELLLHSLHCKLAIVSTAEEGLQYLYKNSKNVDLILLDIDLPGISGLEFLSQVKGNHYLKKIPIILQTGHEILKREKALSLGASDFLKKPYTAEALYKAISQVNLNQERIL